MRLAMHLRAGTTAWPNIGSVVRATGAKTVRGEKNSTMRVFRSKMFGPRRREVFSGYI
jgi:hypothetical protein